MKNDIAFFNVDTQQPSEDMDRLVFRPRVTPMVSQLQAMLDFADANDVLTVCTACVNAGPVEKVLPEGALFISAAADDVRWFGHLDGFRQIWIQKLACASRDLNIENRVFDLFYTNPHTGYVVEELLIPHYVVFGDSAGYCTRTTAEGLLRLGYQVTLISDAIGKGINTEQEKEVILQELCDEGAKCCTTEEFLARGI